MRVFRNAHCSAARGASANKGPCGTTASFDAGPPRRFVTFGTARWGGLAGWGLQPDAPRSEARQAVAARLLSQPNPGKPVSIAGARDPWGAPVADEHTADG